MRSSFYDAELDGSIKEYAQGLLCDGATPRFRGAAQYRQLWDEGLLNPQFSVLRVFTDGGGPCDKVYDALDREQVEGNGGVQGYLESPEGKHSIDTALEGEGVTFEVERFSRKILE